MKKKNDRISNISKKVPSTEKASNIAEEPKVYKVSKRGRRHFLKNTAEGITGITGLIGLSSIISGCEESADIDIQTDGEICTCHVICHCDTVYEGGNQSLHDALWENGYCTCNTICTCNSVNTGGGSGGGGGGGSSYWYPC